VAAEPATTRVPDTHVAATPTVEARLLPVDRFGGVPPVLWQPANAQLTL
jgi:hypothetical protein